MISKLLPPLWSSPGIYVCSKCDHELFSSRSKFEHSSPWPAFTETIHDDSVSKHKERPGAYKVKGSEREHLKFIKMRFILTMCSSRCGVGNVEMDLDMSSQMMGRPRVCLVSEFSASH